MAKQTNKTRFTALKKSNAKRPIKNKRSSKKKDTLLVGTFKKFFGGKASQKTKALSFAFVFGIIGVGFLAVSSAATPNTYSAPTISRAASTSEGSTRNERRSIKVQWSTPSPVPQVAGQRLPAVGANAEYRIKAVSDRSRFGGRRTVTTTVKGTNEGLIKNLRCGNTYTVTAWLATPNGIYRGRSAESRSVRVFVPECKQATTSQSPTSPSRAQIKCTTITNLGNGGAGQYDFVINTDSTTNVLSVGNIRFRNFLYRNNRLVKEGSSTTAVSFRHDLSQPGNYRIKAQVDDNRDGRSRGSTCREITINVPPTPARR